jgi:CPA2 family monovalent cation:H+ antiporter-2
VGAFLVGIALSGEVAEGAQVLLSPLRDLFAAVFFVFFGLSTEPAKIPPVLLPAVLLAAVTVVTKIATGYWATRRAGIAARGRWRAGGALVARGEFSLIIAGLAVAAQLEPQLGPLATAYVLLLVILGPLAARYTEPIAQRLASRRGRPGPPGRQLRRLRRLPGRRRPLPGDTRNPVLGEITACRNPEMGQDECGADDAAHR